MQTWHIYMVLVCAAAFGLGYIAAWAMDQYRNNR